MGVYASILNDGLMINADVDHLDESALVVVSLHDLSPNHLRLVFPKTKRFLLILDHPPEDQPETSLNSTEEETKDSIQVRRVIWDHAPGNSGFSQETRHEIRTGKNYRTAVFLHSSEASSGRLILSLRRLGVKHLVFDESGTWRHESTARVLVARVRVRVVDRCFPSGKKPWNGKHRTAGATPDLLRDFIQSDNRDIPNRNRPPSPESSQVAPCETPLILQYLGSLNSGGAERQAANLAIGLHHQGLRSVVYTTEPPTGPRGHYRLRLESKHVHVQCAGDPVGAADEDEIRLSLAHRIDDEHLKLIQAVPPSLRTAVLDLAGELLLAQPTVLNCWLDSTNIIGALAGLMARVPAIILSTRNVNPSHFPCFYQPWMPEYYRILARSRRVHFVANSEHGARDYADWLGFAVDRFTIIRNGVDTSIMRSMPMHSESSPFEMSFRCSFGFNENQPLIAGVFRLSPEKRPDVFLSVIERVRRHHPDVKAVIAGVGPLESETRRRIRDTGLESVVYLIGQRDDIPAILDTADCLLLTSEQEGLPNCVLEAMAVGCPVVATESGGTCEVITHQQTGLLAPVNDPRSLADRVLHVLSHQDDGQRLIQQAQRHIREHHTLDRLVENSLALYHRATGGSVCLETLSPHPEDESIISGSDADPPLVVTVPETADRFLSEDSTSQYQSP